MALHILLAEDDDDDYEMFMDAAVSVLPDIRIIRIADGTHLIEAVDEPGLNVPDMVFLDLNMPRKNGFDCLTAMRRSEDWKTVPVVIYSTSAHTDQVDQAWKSGANLYIRKPHDFLEIQRMLQKVFAMDMSGETARRDRFMFRA